MKRALLFCLLATAAVTARPAETVTFVVGVWPGPDWTSHTNAFLVTLSDPQQIGYARSLVATGGICKDFDHCIDPDPEFIIECGADGTNRNVALPVQPLWSWHVTGIVSWGMNGMCEAPHCYPWQLEEAIECGALTGRITNAFDSTYNFVAEANPELRLFQYTGEGGDIVLYWTHHAAGLTYDVEYRTSLTAQDWHALGLNSIPAWQNVIVGPWLVSFGPPGACYLTPMAAGASGYFRLRAQP